MLFGGVVFLNCFTRSSDFFSVFWFVAMVSGPGSGPGRGHCVVFLGKILYSHGAFLHPGV